MTSVPSETPPDLTPFLEFAIRIVRTAGGIQMAAFGGALSITKKGTTDLVTQVDVEIERMFRARVEERFPDHDVLGEELGGHRAGAEASPYCWIFDPLDGTTNFAHRLPIFCSSLALEIDGALAVAAVLDPTRDELYTAVRGQGAWLNERPLRVSTTDTLVDALLVTGFPYSVHQDPEETIGLFDAFIRRARAVRRLGSAALDMCYVAAGRMDGFWEQGLGAWDIAAAALLVQEAGGRITDIGGQPFQLRAGRLVASNGLVHDDMLATIAAFQSGRSPNRTD